MHSRPPATDQRAARDGGNDYTAFPAVVPTQRLGNYCPDQRQAGAGFRSYRSSVKKAGRKSEVAYQLASGPQS